MTQRQVEGGLPIQLLLPAHLADRQINTGHGGIVGRGPAPQCYLHQQHAAGQTAQPGQALSAEDGAALARQLHPIEPQQGQQRESPQQVAHHHQRMERQRHRPHAQRRLSDHQHEQAAGDMAQARPAAPAQHEQGNDEAAQSPGKIAVHHLAARLVGFQRTVRVEHGGLLSMGRPRDGQGAVATGPVRAGQSGIGEPGIGAEQYDQHRQEDGGRHQHLLHPHCAPR
ncbi:hypothetical protein D3C79_517900 [compost metagenome]